MLLGLRDPSAITADVQTIEVKSIALWKLLAAGVVTGFSLALGQALFDRADRRFGLRS